VLIEIHFSFQDKSLYALEQHSALKSYVLCYILKGCIGLCSVLRPLQHSIGYTGDGLYRSKDPTNSIEVLKENLQKTNQTTETTQNRHA